MPRSRSFSDRRAPLGTQAATRPRDVRGRTGTEETPLTIRARSVPLSEGMREYIQARAGFQLGRFARSIERVSVRFDRVRRNGDSSPAVRCRIKVVVSRLQSVVAEATALSARQAFGDAVAASARWVQHLHERRTRLRRSPRVRAAG